MRKERKTVGRGNKAHSWKKTVWRTVARKKTVWEGKRAVGKGKQTVGREKRHREKRKIRAGREARPQCDLWWSNQ